MIKHDNGIEFTRGELYDLLTEKSFGRLSQEYNLDPIKFTTALNHYDIPRRNSGDWTKISMGREVPREPLRGERNVRVFVAYDAPRPEKQSWESRNQEQTDSIKNDYLKFVANRTEEKRKEKEKQGKLRQVSTEIDKYDQNKTLYVILDVEVAEEEFSKISLFELDMTVRAINGLTKNGVKNLHQIMTKSVGQLRTMRNIGVTSTKVIINACDSYCRRKKQQKKAEKAREQERTEENAPFSVLMMEFYKLNDDGRKVAVDMVKSLTTIDKFREKE